MDLSVFQRAKSVQDFQRENEAFELVKALKKKEAQGSNLPFQGNSFDAQIANEAYNFNLQKGMTPDDAKRNAIDMVTSGKPSYQKDPVTGNLIPVARPPIFGNLPQPQMQNEVNTNLPGSLGLETLPSSVQIPSISQDEIGGGFTPVPDTQVGATIPMPSKPPVEKKETLFDLTEKTAGVVPALADVYSRTVGQIPNVPIPEDIVQARQTITTAKNDLIRSLSINPRFPVGEIERLEKEINISPRMTDSPKALEARMKSVKQSLETRLVNEERASQDASLPVEARQAALTAAKDIRNFLVTLGEPREQENLSPIQQELKRRGTL